MSCLIGVLADFPVFPFSFASMSQQNHAAPCSCGLCTIDDIGNIHRVFARKLVVDKFSEPRIRDATRPDSCGIGFLGSARSLLNQPIEICNNTFVCIDASASTAREIIAILQDSGSPETGLKTALIEIDRIFAVIVLIAPNKLVVARSNGRMPLSISDISYNDGELISNGIFVSTQSCTLGTNEHYIRPINAGEVVVVEHQTYGQFGFHQDFIVPGADNTRCIRDGIADRLPTAYWCGQPAYLAREKIGQALGDKFCNLAGAKNGEFGDDWLAITIPLGGGPYLTGFSQATGIGQDPSAVIRSRYHPNKIKPLPNCFCGEFAVTDTVEGQNIVVVDIGTKTARQANEICTLVLRMGAKSVRCAFASRVCHNCPYGKGSSKYFRGTTEELRQFIGAEDVVSLTHREIVRAIDNSDRRNCHDRPFCGQCLQH